MSYVAMMNVYGGSRPRTMTGQVPGMENPPPVGVASIIMAKEPRSQIPISIKKAMDGVRARVRNNDIAIKYAAKAHNGIKRVTSNTSSREKS
jgi:hypothetical protein